MTQGDMKPRVFIGSSSEKLHVAKALQGSLGSEVYSTVSDENIFRPAHFIISLFLMHYRTMISVFLLLRVTTL